MPRILVTGANGFIGRKLLPLLVASGMTVRATSRQAPTEPVRGIEAWPEVDLTDGDARLVDLCRDCHAVVHLAGLAHDSTATAESSDASNHGVTRCLARAAAAAGVERFLYLSTIKVCGEGQAAGQEHAYSESDPPAPGDDYARSKWAAEQALQAVCETSGMDYTIIRPPLVYGPGVKANFLALLRLVGTGLPLPLGSIRNRRSMIFVDNLCDLLVRALNAPAAAGRTYHAADITFSTPELIRCIAGAMDMGARLLPCPPVILKVLGSLSGRWSAVNRLLGSLVVDDSHVRRELAWKPPVPVSTAMRQTAEWYLSGRSAEQGGSQ